MKELNMRIGKIMLAGLLLLTVVSTEAKKYTTTSPNGRITVTVGEDVELWLDVKLDGKTVIEVPQIDMTNMTYGIHSVKESVVRDDIIAPF